MKQLFQNLKNGAIEVVDVPIPQPRSGCALVQTAVSLVSVGTERMLVEFGSKSLLGKARARPDLVRQMLDKARREGLLNTIEAAFNRLDQPMPLGYSSAGVITAVGEGLQGFHTGQRVACAGGGYAVHAEYNLVPKNLLTALPDNVDDESAAFCTLGAIAMHGFRLAETQLGERVVVIGLGLLGLLMVGIARAAGCAVLGVDLDSRRVTLAAQMGAAAVIRDEAEAAARAFTQGRGADAVLICADTPSDDPVELAGVVARDRAKVVAVGAVGLSLPRKIYFEKELSFVNSRSYGPGRYDPTYEEQGQDYPIGFVRWTEGRNLEAFVELLSSGRLDAKPLITHRFAIENAMQAYDLITGKTGEPFLGVVLTYAPARPAADQGVSAPLLARSRDGKPGGAVKLGVLGAGNFATATLLPVLKRLPGLELVGIASASGANAAHAKRRFGFAYATSEEAQVLEDASINTIAILTRHNQHARQVLAGLAAGKHVFCEKPLALTADELAEIKHRLLETPSPFPLLMVGFNRRFAPLAKRMAEFFSGRQEALAAHYRVNAGFIPATHWVHDPEQGGGRIIGEGCHFVDFLTFLVGSPPVSVVGFALPDAGRYRGDNAVLTFAFQDGSVGTLTYAANGDKSFPKERIEVFSGGKVAVLDDFRTLEMAANGRQEVIHARLRQDKGHAGEWTAFQSAIAAGGPPPIPYDQLFGVTEATFAAVQALRSGERVSIASGL